MNFVGKYKLVQVRRMNEAKKAFEWYDVEAALAETKDEDRRRELQRDMDTLLSVQEDGTVSHLLPLPPETSLEELMAAGLEMENGLVKLGSEKGKIENGTLYMYDKGMFLAGTEWVKISTEEEGMLDLIVSRYKKME